ncbi:MAG: GerMN domain-containing protein [Ktedonobacterales bacterium]
MMIVRFPRASGRTSALVNRPRGISRGNRWPRVALFSSILTIATVFITACATTSPGATTPTPTATSAAVKVYFTKHPDSDSNPLAVFALTRTTTTTGTQDQATFALEEMLKGPTQAERAQGYYNPFDGQLALQSFCAGPFRNFDLTFDHRGSRFEQGTATFQFCRRVDIPGELAGPRMSAMVTSTLTQFPAIKKVVILNYQGNCFDDLQGQNACLAGTQTGYPVKVYFSKHPDSDNAPRAVFAVKRMSPTLGVATYSISQLIVGPTAAEKAAGYYTPLEGSLSGTSSCAGSDIQIVVDRNRIRAEVGTATMQFCRTIRGLGDTGATVARNEITATLTQFPTIKKVVIVYKDGSCFDDLIGCEPASAPSH